jgi:uncharacterized membrane protein YdbT with pleckstrin-like domain
MGQKYIPGEPSKYQPEGLVIRQVQWAWLWSSMPWLVVIVVLYQTGWIGAIEEWTASILLIVILVPRVVMSRRTRYTLTDDTLVYQRGGITSAKEIPLPIWRISDVQSKPGVFGRALGYQMVDVVMDNGSIARLAYVPILSDVEVQIRTRMASVERPSQEEVADDEAPPEDPSPPSPSSPDSDGPPRA